MNKLLKAVLVIGGVMLGAAVFLFWAKANVTAQNREATKFVSPFRVTLQSVDTLGWDHEVEAREVLQYLGELGYLDAGKFEVEELPDFGIWGFCHPASGIVAILFEDKQQLKVEIGYTLMDGDIESFSTAAIPVLDLPPYLNLKRFEIDLSAHPEKVKDLHQAAIVALGDRKTDACTLQGFSTEFMDAWAREMDWRIENGGISEIEAERLLKLGGIDPTPGLISWLRRGWEMKIEEFKQGQ
ncbi:MAG: hypothetical protein ACKVHO_16965 [Verrucomicrobiia bacterium]